MRNSMSSILFTPLKIPKIVPNDWDEWWHVWNTYRRPVVKTNKNHNDAIGLFNGLDLFNSKTKLLYYTVAECPKFKVVDNILDQIYDRIPIELEAVRVLENNYAVPFHSDTNTLVYELRCFLWNTYTNPVWTFRYLDQRKTLIMPPDTNTFFYKDYPLQHSSIYHPQRTKGILAIYGKFKKEFKHLVNWSYINYKDYAWLTD